MPYGISEQDDLPIKDFSESEDVPVDLSMTDVGRVLGCENLAAKLWYFDEGEAIRYHAHAEQEEFFFVVDGTFSLTLGNPGAKETVDVRPGAVWRATPSIGRGYRCTSPEGGTVLAIGVPPVEDPPLEPVPADELDEPLE